MKGIDSERRYQKKGAAVLRLLSFRKRLVPLKLFAYCYVKAIIYKLFF